MDLFLTHGFHVLDVAEGSPLTFILYFDASRAPTHPWWAQDPIGSDDRPAGGGFHEISNFCSWDSRPSVWGEGSQPSGPQSSSSCEADLTSPETGGWVALAPFRCGAALSRGLLAQVPCSSGGGVASGSQNQKVGHPRCTVPQGLDPGWEAGPSAMVRRERLTPDGGGGSSS